MGDFKAFEIEHRFHGISPQQLCSSASEQEVLTFVPLETQPGGSAAEELSWRTVVRGPSCQPNQGNVLCE